jgi:hypothetical protein
MFPLVEIPELVQHYAPFFASVFSERAFIQFQRYISGLIVSENKTVEGINRLFVIEVRNQSSLNRFLTESPFSVEDLNQARLALLASLPGTQMKQKGVLSVDDTHLSHYGRFFDQIAYLYDPAEKRHMWAHNLVNLHYSDDLTDYPVAFQLWKPADLEKLERELPAVGVKLRASKFALKHEDPKKWRNYLLGVWRRHQSKPEVAELYKSKLLIARYLLQARVADNPTPKLPVAFDNWYTKPAFCRFLDKELKLRYVGDLAVDDEVLLASGPESLESFAQRLKKEHLAGVESGGERVFHKISFDYKGERETYYSYCRNHRIRNFGKQRLVISHRQSDLSDGPIFTNSNCLHWQAPGIMRIRRHRWPVEAYHEESKEEGLDKYQVRDFEAIYRHIALVAVTYSLLRAAPHDQALLHKLQRQLEFNLEDSAAFWRRAAQAQSLWVLACFITAAVTQGHALCEVMAPVLAAVCY